MIAVVIPARQEAPALRERARCLAAHPSVFRVFIVRPCAAEGTRARVAAPREVVGGVQSLDAPLGRAAQMNAGARLAVADHLLFLHGDTALEPGALTALARAIAREPHRAFAFTLGFSSQRWGYRLLAALAARRDRRSPYPLGDQGLALPRRTFLAMGGFEDLPLFEDVRFLARLRRRRLLRVLPERAITSAARFERHGLVRTLAANGALLALHAAGLRPESLARLYYGAAYLEAWRTADPRRRERGWMSKGQSEEAIGRDAREIGV